MFCVIQEIQRKKQPKDGDYKEYEVQSCTLRNMDGDVLKTYYSYYPTYSAGNFSRPIKTAYKISIHQSYREGGKVKKRQYAIGTIDYYSLILWGYYDTIDTGVKIAAESLGVSYDDIYQLVEDKLIPIQKKITKEYHATEEYKVTQQRKKIQERYQKAKKAFAKKYSVDEQEYDACYNVFGDVMNQDYLDQIINNAKYYSSYYQNYYSNYGRSSSDNHRYSSSYEFKKPSTYTESETAILKSFYRTLSKTFHPDLNHDKDTTAEMQLLNKLKETWEV